MINLKNKRILEFLIIIKFQKLETDSSKWFKPVLYWGQFSPSTNPISTSGSRVFQTVILVVWWAWQMLNTEKGPN